MNLKAFSIALFEAPLILLLISCASLDASMKYGNKHKSLKTRDKTSFTIEGFVKDSGYPQMEMPEARA